MVGGDQSQIKAGKKSAAYNNKKGNTDTSQVDNIDARLGFVENAFQNFAPRLENVEEHLDITTSNNTTSPDQDDPDLKEKKNELFGVSKK